MVRCFVALSGGIQNIRGDGLFAMNPFAHFRSSKNKNSVALLAIAIFALAFGAAGCDKLKARDLLNKGVAAYRDGKFDQSIEDFKQAKDLDPTLTNARLYLATAYATQYIPGAPSDENIRMGQAAVKEFQDVLQQIRTIFRPSTASARFSTTWRELPTARRCLRNRRATT